MLGTTVGNTFLVAGFVFTLLPFIGVYWLFVMIFRRRFFVPELLCFAALWAVEYALWNWLQLPW